MDWIGMKVMHRLAAQTVLAAGVVLAAGNAALALPPLIGQWNFEEGSGTTAADSSGNGLNGTINNASYIPGRIGSYALSFSGSDSYVQVTNSALLNPGSIGISAWFKPASVDQGYGELLAKGEPTADKAGYSTQYLGDQTVNAIFGSGTNTTGLNSVNPYADNLWHFVAANLGSNGLNLWIDGVQISSGSSQSPIFTTAADLFFASSTGPANFFTGALDDIQLFDGTLTDQEVQTLFQGSTAATPAPAAVLGALVAGRYSRRIRRRIQGGNGIKP